MKKVLAGLLAMTMVAPMTTVASAGMTIKQESQQLEKENSQSYLEDREERLDQWYNQSKVGMMYHFGVQTGDPRNITSNQFQNYQFKTLEEYNAAIEDVDVKEWVAQAKKVGASYIEFAGFHSCLGYVRPWHSEVPGIPCTDRDLLGELIEEAHKEDIKVVVYMTTALNHASHNKFGWYKPEEYVAYAKEKHADYTTKKNGGVPLTDEQWEVSFNLQNNSYGFGAFTFDEVEYLMKNYDVDGFWFDAFANPTWYPEDSYPWPNGFEYDGCWGGCSSEAEHQKNYPEIKRYRYDEKAFKENYFYKRDILEHVHDIDPDCVTFTNNFAPVIPADVLSQETFSHGGQYKLIGNVPNIREATFLPGGYDNPWGMTWWYTQPKNVNPAGELKRIVYNAIAGGGSCIAEGPSLDAEFPEYEEVFNTYVENFNEWSSEAWLDEEAVKSDRIANSSADTDVVTTYNEKTDAYYVHILKSSKKKTVTLTDTVKFFGKVTDLKTGEEIPYTQENGKITFTIDDWTNYDADGDLIIKLENKGINVTAADVAQYITNSYTPETDGFWLKQPAGVEGFETKLSYTSDENVIDLDGFVAPTDEEKNVTIKFKVSNAKEETDFAETEEIQVTIGGNSVQSDKIPQSQMKATASSIYINDINGHGPQNVLDGNGGTMWHSQEGVPQSITLNLGGEYNISQITCLPRADMDMSNFTDYKIWVSDDGNVFTEVQLGTIKAGEGEQTITLDQPQKASYVKIEALDSVTSTNGNKYVSCSEINVFYKKEQEKMTKEILQNVIDEAEKMDASIYYTKGILNLLEKTEEAKEIVAKENPTVKEMVIAADAIAAATDALQKVDNNVALNKPTKISEAWNGDFGGEKAVDGDIHTRWATRNVMTQFLEVDLQELQTINRIELKVYAAPEYPVKNKAVPFKLSYKDLEGNWVECFNSDKDDLTVKLPPITEENLQEYVDHWKYQGCVYVNQNTGEVLQTEVTAIFDAVETTALRYETLIPNDLTFMEFEAYASIDKTNLQETYNQYKDIVQDHYTEESWERFVDARKEAEKLLAEDYNPTQQEMDEASEKLEKAYEELEISVKTTFTVDVINGTGSGEYAYNEKVTAKADAPAAGMKFAGWKVDGEIVSTESEYVFYASNNMKLEAFYSEDGAVAAEAKALVTNVITTKNAKGTYDVKFVGQLVLPEGYTLKDAGLVWSSKDTTELVLGKGLKPTYIKQIGDTNQFSVTIKGMPAGRFLRGKIFATVEKDGVESIIYSTEKRAEAK